MHRMKMLGLAAIGTTALWCISSSPASAGGPLLLAPWALGHVLRALTVPFIVAAAAASASASYDYDEPAYSPPPSYPNYYGRPPAYYGGAPGYYGAPAYYPGPGYYAPPASYYAPGPAYYGGPHAYYGYGRPYARRYWPRGYDAAPRLRYSGPHGPQAWHGGGGYYRHR